MEGQNNLFVSAFGIYTELSSAHMASIAVVCVCCTHDQVVKYLARAWYANCV